MTMIPNRVRRTRKAGVRGIPEGAVYVGRGPGSKWGNPFPAYDTTVRERETATLLFLNLLRGRDTHPDPEHLAAYPSLEEIRSELGGKDLACWCPLPDEGEDDHCHASVLLLAANDYMANVGSGVCDRCWTFDLLPDRFPLCPECGRPWDRRSLHGVQSATEATNARRITK